MITLVRTATPKLQATYIPDQHGIAWWGVPDLAATLAGAGLPLGRAMTVRLAMPMNDSVVAGDVEARVTDLSETIGFLDDLVGGDIFGESAQAWARAARFGVGRQSTAPHAELQVIAGAMPPAGHAVLNDEETAVMAPSALLEHFDSAVATMGVLGSGVVQATLRPYQAHGVSWLRDRAARGEGAVLADEMGLGKTLQAIAVLATRIDAGPHLVVSPTSLIGNWLREIGRFAPTLDVQRYHGAGRVLPDSLTSGTVVVTSYPLVRSDSLLSFREWDVVVFDEAQQVKNPTAKATRAAAALRANCRIAMTGTPVENNLDDLWSIFSLTNPGVLGTRGRFRQRFATPIEQRRSATAAARLGRIVERHMLRRTKDRVATELPARIDTAVVCTLTDEQIRLYRDAVDGAFDEGFGSGPGRSGRVLALLTELKQICNHPAQFLGDAAEAEPGRSGKFDRAHEMVAEIVDDGARALLFTQYRVMGELLSSGLADTLGGRPIPFLHGGLPIARRDELVRAFQQDEDAPQVLI